MKDIISESKLVVLNVVPMLMFSPSHERCWITQPRSPCWHKYKHLIVLALIPLVDKSTPLVVVIRDHLALPNLTGPLNPLLGPLISPSYRRFLPLSDAYCPRLRRFAFLASHHLSLPSDALAEGTYAWVSGPAYETPAEGRFLRAAGADVVGMSTVPEVVAAKDEGMDVIVLSLVTNAVVIPGKYRSIKEEVEAEVGSPFSLPGRNCY